MAKTKNQHVVPLGNGWAVRREGATRFTIITESQKDAITVARGIAKVGKSEIVIYGRNGQIRERNSYGDNADASQRKKRK